MRLTEEWNNLFKTDGKIYLYGAGSVAGLLVQKAMQDGVDDKIKGSLVSEKELATPDFIGSIPVLVAESVEDKDTVVLVATSRKWSDEIMLQALKQGFTNIRDGFRYVHVYDEATVLDESMEKDINKLETDGINSNTLKEKIKIMYGKNQLFDENGRFYQSLPLLDIEGDRPSDIRIDTYKLEQLLEGKNVIDVGCNTGFLDMTLSAVVSSICGIEYNQSLVDIANVVLGYFRKQDQLDNVTVQQADFLEFQATQKYDVVLFFAVHGWLDCSAKEGVERICDLLMDDGMVVFESQDLEKGDLLYQQYCDCFEKSGMRMIRGGQYMR